MLIPILGSIDKIPLLDTLSKEALGVNAPRVAFTRSNDERMDVATSALGNMLGAFGIGAGLDRLLKTIFKKAVSTGAGSARQWAAAGSSLAIYSAVFSIMWAMPFIRNYVTAKRTGKTSYSEVIGSNAGKKDDAATLQKSLENYSCKAISILGLGLAGTLAATLGAKAAIRRGVSFERLGKAGRIIAKWGLKDGSFNDFKGLRAVMFWGVPAYAGWIHAARDKYEIKEQILKFAAFAFSFLVPQKLMDRFYAGKFASLQEKGLDVTYENIIHHLSGTAQKDAIRHWAQRNLLGLASAIVLLGTLPTVLNITLTKKRLSREQQPKLQPGNSPLRRKPFEIWGQRPEQPAIAFPMPSA